MIYLLCLHGVRTGGPEAIHQLSDALLKQGLPARMVYYDWTQIARWEQEPYTEEVKFGLRPNPIPDYERYAIVPDDRVGDFDGFTIVLPEPLAHLAPRFKRAKVLIWWLSVDNGLGSLSRVNLNLLRAANVYHAAQSTYAARFLDALQLRSVGFLSDYTTDLSRYAAPLPREMRKPIVAINATAHKLAGFDVDRMIAAIMEAHPIALCTKINGMERGALAEIFAKAKVYVDMGNFPGKDRMPREAAAMGAIPLLRDCGAARELDLPFPIIAHDASPEAAGLFVADVLSNPRVREIHFDPSAERAQFFAEAHGVFSKLMEKVDA